MLFLILVAEVSGSNF